MAFDVARFHAEISGMNGLASPAKFRLRVHASWANESRLEFLVHQAEQPGVSLHHADTRPLGYGVINTQPLVPDYLPIRIGVLSDEGGLAETFFQRWAQRAVEYRYVPGGAQTQTDGAYPFQVRYRADYAAQVVIETMSHEGELRTTTTLHDAWCRAVEPMQLAWEASDQVQVLPVHVHYTSWTSNRLSGEQTQQ